MELRVPRVRDGSFFPSLLEPRRRAERALVGAVQEAYVQGVFTRRVDELVKALRITGISKSRLSRLCEEPDAEVGRFRNRRLCEEYPCIRLDATFPEVRQEGRVVSTAVVVAVAVTATGERGVLGPDVGPSHKGLNDAIAATLSGASWQRCRVHFRRNALSHVPRTSAQPYCEGLLTSLSDICDNLLAMALRYLRKSGVILLIAVASGMLAVGSVWAAHDCCGHPSGNADATDSGTGDSSSSDECVCACCQAEQLISLFSGVSFQIDSRWSVEISSVFPASRFETDIFRPPLA